MNTQNIHILNKLTILMLLLSFLSVSNNIFSQNQPDNTRKQVGIELNYSKQFVESEIFPELKSNFGFGVNYEFSELIRGGLFLNYGQFSYGFAHDELGIIGVNVDVTDRHFKYGINTELHPFSTLIPDFYAVDIVFDFLLGVSSCTSNYWENQHKFLFGGSLGINLNISKYFGVFYERCYDNINKKCIFTEFSYNLKTAGFNRFGLNIRFNGPKKWRKE